MSIQIFPEWKIFAIFLKSERHVKPSSSVKYYYVKIAEYFKDKEWDRKNFRSMLYDLEMGKLTENPVLYNSLNKFIQTAKYIDFYFETKITYEFPSYPTQEPKKEKIILTDAQMENISLCDTTSAFFTSEMGVEYARERIHRYNTMFQLMRFSGMPPDDICRLKWDNDNGTHFTLVRMKTGGKREVPILDDTRKMLDKIKKYNHGYIFGGRRGRCNPKALRRELKERVKILGYDERITPYSFRYSFVTLSVRHGGESTLSRIAKIAGHTIQTAHKHYLQYDVSDLKDALISSHPGLRKDQDIDTLKRILFETAKKLVDMSKYDVYIKIKPKEGNFREMQLS